MTLRFTRRHALAGGLAAMATLAAPAVLRAAAATTTITGPAFGTFWSLTAPFGTDPEALRPVLEQTIMRIDRAMSPWRFDSVISQFNRSESTDFQRIDKETAAVAGAAIALSQASAGAFDPSVGPLVAQWGFGPIAGTIPEGRPRFSVADNVLRKEHPDLTLDLCGIAKGYAVDALVRDLLERSIEHFVLDLGGEVAARGNHPEGRPWRIAIEDPRPGRDGAAEIVTLGTLAIATSGDRHNSFMLGTRRHSHIIDPETDEPVSAAIASVSVLSKSAMIADGWATALMAAGARGPELARKAGLDALFLLREGSDFRIRTTNRFDDHLA